MEIAFFAAVLAALAFAERFPTLRLVPLPFLRRGFATDLFYFLTGATILGLALREIAAAAFGPDGLVTPFLDAVPALPALVAAIVLYDLGGYLSHFLLHRSEALWRVHKVHHSSRALDWLATFRAHTLEHLLRHTLSSVGLLALGFPLPAVAVAAAAYASWAAFNHANLRWSAGALERIFVTPRLHRLHHVPATSESNLGTIFSFWDRARGRLVTDPTSALAVAPIGVPGALATYPQDLRSQLVEPFRRRRRERRAAPATTDLNEDAA